MRQLQIILFLLFPAILFSQENDSSFKIGLNEAKELAYEKSLKLRDQNIDVEIAQTEVDQAIAEGLPQINANFNYQWNLLNAFAQRTNNDGEVVIPALIGTFDNLEQTVVNTNGVQTTTDISGEVQGVALESIGGFFSQLGDAFVAQHTGTAGISVNQQIFDGVYLLGLEASKVFVELSEVQLAPTKRDIDKAVEKAYYGVLITQENIDIVTKNQENLSQLLYETTKIYEAGFAEQLDVDRLQLSINILENSKKTLEKIEQLNYDVLKNAMSIPLSSEIELTESIEKFEEYALGDEIIAEIADPQLLPEFRILDVQEKIQDLDIQRSEKEKLPNVSAFFNGAYNYQGEPFIFTNGFDNWFPNVAVGLNVSMPIFDGNLRKNQIKEKQLQLEKIKLSRETLQTNVDIQIENAMTAFTNARTEIKSQKETIALAEKIYNVTQIKYREGVGTSLELNQAQQDLYSAQQGYINALFNLLIAKVDIEQAVGK